MKARAIKMIMNGKLTTKLMVVTGLAMSVCAAFAQDQRPMHGRYGGGVFQGDPDLNATSALLRAGGGGENFTMERALISLMGGSWERDEMRRLSETYGRGNVHTWSIVAAYATKDAMRRMGEANWTLPETGLRGHALATALVNDGTGPNKHFTSDRFCDRLFSHKVHDRVMDDVDREYGADADGTFHQISNQLFFDMAQSLDMINVRQAGFH